jgi:hypothetical protein
MSSAVTAKGSIVLHISRNARRGFAISCCAIVEGHYQREAVVSLVNCPPPEQSQD